MRISDWSSDVCSSDLVDAGQWHKAQKPEYNQGAQGKPKALLEIGRLRKFRKAYTGCHLVGSRCHICLQPRSITAPGGVPESISGGSRSCRSEEHTSELQSLMRTSYAVYCLTK